MLVLPSGFLDTVATMSPTLSKVRPSMRESTQTQESDGFSSFPWLQILIEVVSNNAETEKKLGKRCKEFREKHDAYERESAALKRDYESLLQEQTSLLSQCTSLTTQSEEIKAKLAACEENEEKLQELKKRYEGLKESSTQLERRLSQIESEKVAIDGKLTLCNTQIEELEQEVKTLTSSIEESNQRVVALETDLQDAQEQHRASELRLSASVSNVSALRKSLSSVQEELSSTRNSLEQSQSSLDSQTRDNHFYQFVPSLDQKIWTHLITNKCQEIKNPVLLACYLVSALFRYTVYKLIYSQWLVHNQLCYAYQMHQTSASFRQTTLSIEESVLKTFVAQSMNAQVSLKTHG
jgi:predicted  nucleic acid-binding Zn-ribbon protein